MASKIPISAAIISGLIAEENNKKRHQPLPTRVRWRLVHAPPASRWLKSNDSVENTRRALSTATLGDSVPNARTAKSIIAGRLGPGQNEIVGPPCLWLSARCDIDQNRREVRQSTGLAGRDTTQLAAILSGAGSRLERLGCNRHLCLLVTVPRKSSNVEVAAGTSRATANLQAGEVKVETRLSLKTSKSNLRRLQSAGRWRRKFDQCTAR